MRVPGSYSSLEKEKAAGRDIRMVYSTLDALDIAKKNKNKEVVFLGVGFETTIPTVAMSILIAKKEKIKNYSVLCGHKTMPEALKILASDKALKIDGFILPGHVSTIIGPKPYAFLASSLKKRCVITGFEPLDILQGIHMLINQKKPKVGVQYTRIIEAPGNKKAEAVITKVFEKASAEWRGIGNIKGSGLKIRKTYSEYDAERKFKVSIRPVRENPGCACGEVLKGIKIPTECKLFGRTCTPEHPVGSCMVSSEGTCAAYYKYSTSIRS
jgi:hydrogenase expression/formation protein HypD